MQNWFVTSILLLFLAAPAVALETKAQFAVLIDDSTGAVLFEKQADTQMQPASMSKLMTIYVLMEHLKNGSVKLEDTFSVSEKAWSMQGSKSFVELGNQISVEDLLRGIVIQSGNDACIVVAEGIAGSEETFVEKMNETAARIGLKNSHFNNATGWPDPEHLVTPHDLAILAHRLIHDFPEYYHYFAEKEFTYHGIKQQNRNFLLGGSLGIDGLKTGHTEEAGYGITISAKQGDRRLIAVVHGLSSMAERLQEAEVLLNYGFRNFDNKTLLKANEVVGEAELWLGQKDTVSLVAPEEVIMTLPRGGGKAPTYVLRYNSPVSAPVKKGDHVADLVVTLADVPPVVVPLVAGEDVKKRGAFGRIWPMLKYYISQ